MIVGSVLLVIAAGVLLGFGLVRLSESLLYSAIGVSALACSSDWVSAIAGRADW